MEDASSRHRTVEALDALDDPAGTVVGMSAGLGDLDLLVVDPDTVAGVSNGVVFAAAAIGAAAPGSYRVVDADGSLLAVYVSDGRRAKPEVVVA